MPDLGKEGTMQRTPLALAALGALALTACAKTVDLDAARAELQAADAAYSGLFATMYADSFAAMYTADAKMYPPNDSARAGTEAIRAFGAQFADMQGFSVTFHPVDLGVGGGGDMGYTLSHYVATFTGPDGNPGTDRGHDFHVWRKQADGSWKIVVDIWNSEVAMAMPEPAPAPRRR